MNYHIEFEDHGQDFLTWIIERGRVVDSLPFQQDIWVGSKVLSSLPLLKGQCITIRTKYGDKTSIRYPLTVAKPLPTAYGYEVEIETDDWIPHKDGGLQRRKITKHWAVKSYRAAVRKGLAIKRAHSVTKLTPMSEAEYIRAFGDRRMNSES